MLKEEIHLIKNSLRYFDELVENSGSSIVYQNYRYVRDYIFYGKAIAKSEGVPKEQFQLGLIAIIIYQITQSGDGQKLPDEESLLKKIIDINQLTTKEAEPLYNYIQFLSRQEPPKNSVEMVLLDIMNIHLGLPDAFEWLALKKLRMEFINESKFTDIEWEQYCHQYYLKNAFYTRYANEKYGLMRSRNFTELEKRLEKITLGHTKVNRKQDENFALTDREGENLFKIAFRNYLNLIGIADKKAHLLIQVNAILASVIIGFTIRRTDSTWYYIIPTVMILVVAGLTIFYAILASKPLNHLNSVNTEKEQFFFGSFDRVDPYFKNVTWDKYSLDIKQLFKGDKENVFDELIRESYQVRKVLSRKFSYLAIAYKIFIAGQLLSIGIFMVMAILKI